MKRNKTQKGITLVALIITIIVLLILAVVTIRAVTGDGIIAHAKNTRNQYEQKAAEENTLLEDLSGYITGQLSEGWIQNKTEVKNVKTKQILTVGQTVTNYTAGGKTWKVLGAENGKLLLMSTTNVKDGHSLAGSTAGWSTVENRFAGAESELTQICKDAITDAGEGNSIRSAKVEDINRITGYKAEATGDGNPYRTHELNEYGNKVTYSLNGGKVAYASTNPEKNGTSTFEIFEMPDRTTLTANAPMILKSSVYYYYPHSLTTSDSITGELKGIATDSEAYRLLFKNEDNTSHSEYWLASSYVNPGASVASFGGRWIHNGAVTFVRFWHTRSGTDGLASNVRPVVSLGLDFQPIV